MTAKRQTLTAWAVIAIATFGAGVIEAILGGLGL